MNNEQVYAQLRDLVKNMNVEVILPTSITGHRTTDASVPTDRLADMLLSPNRVQDGVLTMCVAKNRKPPESTDNYHVAVFDFDKKDVNDVSHP